MSFQAVPFGRTEFIIDGLEFPLDLRVCSHRRKVSSPTFAASGHRQPGTVDEAFQQNKLSFGRKTSKLALDFVQGWRRHSVRIFRFSSAKSTGGYWWRFDNDFRS